MTSPQQPYTGTDFYCDVALADPGALEVVHQGEHVLVYHHTRPFWQVHLVAVPRRHVPSLTDLGEATEVELRALLSAIQQVARQVEAEHGAAAVTTNLGAYQDSEHLHVHIHSGPRR